MTHPEPQPASRKPAAKKILAGLVIAVTAVLLVFGTFLISLPAMVASGWFREQVRTRIAAQLGTAVAIESLAFGWRSGFSLAGLAIATDDDPPLLFLERLHVAVNVPSPGHRRIGVDILLKNLEMAVKRDISGKTNVETVLARLIKPAAATQPKQAPEPGPVRVPLPVDVAARIRLTESRLTVDDRMQDRKLALENLRFSLDAPSVRDMPVVVEAASDVWLDGRQVSPVAFRASADKLLSPDGTLRPDAAEARLDAAFPGGRLEFGVGPGLQRMAGSGDLDLEPLSRMLARLIPSTTLPKASGRIEAKVRAAAPNGQAGTFEMAVEGIRLSVSDWPAAGRHPAPLDLSFTHTGRFDADLAAVTIETGRLKVPGMAELRWKGTISGLAGGMDRADLDLKIEASADADAVGSRVLAVLDPPPEIQEIAGNVEASAVLTGRIADRIAVASYASGRGLGLTGAPTGWEPLGPVDFEWSGTTTYDTTGGSLTLTGGTLTVDQSNRLMCSGSISGLDQGKDALRYRLETALSVDLPSLARLVTPLLPAPLSPSETAGSLSLEATLTGSPESRSELAIKARANALVYTGPATGYHRVGPLTAEISQQAVFDKTEGTLHVSGGHASVQQTSRFSWSGRVNGLQTGNPQLALAIGPLTADIKGLAAPVSAMFPPSAAAWLAAVDGNPTVTADSIEIDLSLAGLSGDVTAGGIALTLAGAVLPAGNTTVSVTDATLTVARFEATLAGGFPTQFLLDLSAGIGRLEATGDTPLALSGLRLSGATLSAGALERDSATPFGITGSIRIGESVSVDSVRIADRLAAERITHSLAAALFLTGSGGHGTVEGLQLAIPRMTVWIPDRKPVETGLTFTAAAQRIGLDRIRPFPASVRGAKAAFQLGELIALTLAADAERSETPDVNTDGVLRVDLSKLAELLPLASTGIRRISGHTRLRWQAAGRVPSPADLAKLAFPLPADFEPRRDLAFLDRIRLEAALEDVALTLNGSSGQAVAIGPVNTDKPLTYVLDGGSLDGSFSGRISSGEIDPGDANPLSRPISVTVEMSGSHRGIDALILEESVAVLPLDLHQQFQCRLEGLDRILRSEAPARPAVWIQHLTGEAETRFRMAGTGAEAAWPMGLPVQGAVEAGAAVDLKRSGETAITARTWIQAPGLSVSEAAGAQVKNLRLDLDLEKRLPVHIGRPDRLSAGKTADSTPLSVRVMGTRMSRSGGNRVPDAAGGKNPTIVPLAAAPKPAVSAEAATVRVGALSVDARHVQSGFSLEGGLPAIDRFTAELLNGSVAGSAAVLRQPDGFHLNLQTAFTGVEARWLRGQTDPREGDNDEFNGRLYLDVPLAVEPSAVLDNLGVDVQLNRIGRKAFSELLYALDPTESNEAIVAQRRLLANGSPRWIRILAREGALSMEGEVQVGGETIALPRLDRFNLTALSLPGDIESRLAAMKRVIRTLEWASADYLVVDPSDGTIRFGRKE